MFTHMVHQGTPGVLMPFMVVIETISNVICPGTLAVRLAANKITEHLLLHSLRRNRERFRCNVVVFSSFLLFSQNLSLILESAVAVTQYYVFVVVKTLYGREVNKFISFLVELV